MFFDHFRFDIPNAFYEKLKQWETVNLSHNLLTTFYLTGPSKIVTLDLSFNQLTRFPAIAYTKALVSALCRLVMKITHP